MCPYSYTHDTPQHTHTTIKIIFNNYENVLLILIKSRPSERGTAEGLRCLSLSLVDHHFSHSTPASAALALQGSCCLLHVWLTPTHPEMLTPDRSQKPLLPLLSPGSVRLFCTALLITTGFNFYIYLHQMSSGERGCAKEKPSIW